MRYKDLNYGDIFADDYGVWIRGGSDRLIRKRQDLFSKTPVLSDNEQLVAKLTTEEINLLKEQGYEW